MNRCARITGLPWIRRRDLVRGRGGFEFTTLAPLGEREEEFFLI
jgi:hypothetical protein